MPVILEPADLAVMAGRRRGRSWALLRPAPIGTVRLWPVSRAVNSVRNNGPELLATMADPGPESSADAVWDVNPA